MKFADYLYVLKYGRVVMEGRARGIRTFDRPGRCLSGCLIDVRLSAEATHHRTSARRQGRPRRRPHLADLWRAALQLCPGARASPTATPTDFARLGIRKGDHVAVMLPNCPEFIWTIWGLGKLGAVTVPLNTAARGELLRYFITQSDSSVRRRRQRMGRSRGRGARRANIGCGPSSPSAAPEQDSRIAAGRCVDLADVWPRRAADEPDTDAGARQRSAIHHVYVGNDRPLEGRDQPAFAGAWRRPLAGAELRLSPRRRALHLPAAVPRQCALVFLLCGVVGGLRAGGLAAFLGQQLLGRDQGEPAPPSSIRWAR